MKRYKNILSFGLMIGLLITYSCRETIVPSEKELTDYAWTLYEADDFSEANQWFRDGFDKDSGYMDAYNGLAWSFGKLGFIDSAITYFELGKTLSWDESLTPGVNLDIFAGLTFANRAIGNDSLARVYGRSFFAAQDPVSSEPWIFPHNSLMNHLDVRLSLASAYFSLAKFDSCVTEVRTIHSGLAITKTFAPDINTVLGQDELVKELETLQDLLLIQ